MPFSVLALKGRQGVLFVVRVWRASHDPAAFKRAFEVVQDAPQGRDHVRLSVDHVGPIAVTVGAGHLALQAADQRSDIDCGLGRRGTHGVALLVNLHVFSISGPEGRSSVLRLVFAGDGASAVPHVAVECIGVDCRAIFAVALGTGVRDCGDDGVAMLVELQCVGGHVFSVSGPEGPSCGPP